MLLWFTNFSNNIMKNVLKVCIFNWHDYENIIQLLRHKETVSAGVLKTQNLIESSLHVISQYVSI